MLPLSQGQLTLLSTCPRKFKYVFFDALSSPSSYEQQAKTKWGSQFHRLMQQKTLNLPIEIMSAADADMMRRLNALAKEAPELFGHSAARYSEQRRTLAFNGYLLTVIYDFVIESASSAQIFDWKTQQQPPRQDWLQKDWQTRLYLYVLSETTGLAPEQISMTYGFVRSEPTQNEPTQNEPTQSKPTQNEPTQNEPTQNEPTQSKCDLPSPAPTFYKFGYSAAQHRKTQVALEQLTDKLTGGIALMEAGNEAAGFPKVDVAKGICERCPFAIRCDRASSALPNSRSRRADDPYQLLRAAQKITIDTVEEIPL